MVSFLWSITVKAIQNCRRCPFYNNVEKRWAKSTFFVGESDCERLIKHKPSTQVINCNYLVKLTMILFLTSINYKDCKLQTLTTSLGWLVLFLTSLLMITSGNYFRISEKHLSSAVNIGQRTKFLLQLALKVRDFFTYNNNCCWGTTYCCYFPVFPMLQLFTFGKELLIALCRGYKPSGLRLAFSLQPILYPKNERQQGKRRLLGSQKKYWIENIWKKHGNFLSE